jgi:serine/threonine protein kinase
MPYSVAGGDLAEWLDVAYQVLVDRDADGRLSAEGSAGIDNLTQRLARARKCLALLDRVRADSSSLNDFVLGSADDEQPKQLGRFQLVRRLGGGAHAIVYLARDPVLNRNVALKVPRSQLIESNQLRQRFLRESETVARLTHPNLVPVYELGFAGPVCFIVQAYVAGPTLRDWLASRGPMPADTAARLIHEVARGVAYVHRHRIIHRDIKPGNILLETAFATSSDEESLEFTPKLTDFGLAKLLERPGGLTQSQAMIGTPAYMAPEQVDGRVDEIGPATDVYGLGATLYEMLTGQPPFGADSTWETLRRIRNSEFPAPRALSPQIPRDLEAICLKCLEHASARRYSSAEELANDLQRFLQHEPVCARLPSPLERAVKWSRRRPLVASLATLLSLSIVAGFSVFAWQWRQAAKQRDMAMTNYRIAHQGLLDLQQAAISDKRFDHHTFDEFRRSITESAYGYIRQLREKNRGNRQIDWDIADMGYQLAHAHLARRDYETVREICSSIIPEWEILARESDNERDAKYFLAKSHRMMATALRGCGASIDTAIDEMDKSAAILERLVRANPDEHGLKNALADTYLTTASFLHFGGELDRALLYCDKAVELRRIAFYHAPQDRLMQRQLAEAHYRKAARLFVLREYSRAEEECVRALKLLEPLQNLEYDQPTTGIYVARCFRLRGDSAAEAGKTEISAKLHAAGLAGLTDLASAFPRHEQVAELLRVSQERVMEQSAVTLD